MRTPPLSVIASWPQPNYINPQTGGLTNLVVGIVGWILVTIIVTIRLYTRRIISRSLGWDDILITVAYIPALAFAVLGLVAEYRLGLNRHEWDVPPTEITPGIRIALASEIIFDSATTLTKLSMLALLYRLARASSNRFRCLVVGLSVLISVNSIVFLLVSLLQCRPLSEYWTVSFSPQNCTDDAAHLLAAGTVNTVTDFIVVSLPVLVVFQVRELSRRQFVIINVLFAFGYLATAAGAVRTFFTWLMTTAPDFDVSWHAQLVWLSSTIELDIGIICASIPATKPFFVRYLPRILDSVASRSRLTDSSSPAKYPIKGSMLSEGSLLVSIVFDVRDAPMVPKVWRRRNDEEEEADTQSLPVRGPKKLTYGDLNKPLPAIIQSRWSRWSE